MAELGGDEELDPRHPDVATIVEILRNRRIELGWSQWDLAIRTGSAQSRISEIETGQTPNPGVRAFAVLARAMGLRLVLEDERFFLKEEVEVGTVDEDL